MCKVRGSGPRRRGPSRRFGVHKAPSLFTAGPAVARRINGLIKHAILPVMQSLSMPRRREREKERGFIRPAPPLCPRVHASPGRSCGRISPAPLLYARLHSILARNRRNAPIEAALREINVPYAKRTFIPRSILKPRSPADLHNCRRSR